MKLLGKNFINHEERIIVPGSYAVFDANNIYVESHNLEVKEKDRVCFIRFESGTLSGTIMNSDGSCMDIEEANDFIKDTAVNEVIDLDLYGYGFFYYYNIIPEIAIFDNE